MAAKAAGRGYASAAAAAAVLAGGGNGGGGVGSKGGGRGSSSNAVGMGSLDSSNNNNNNGGGGCGGGGCGGGKPSWDLAPLHQRSVASSLDSSGALRTDLNLDTVSQCLLLTCVHHLLRRRIRFLYSFVHRRSLSPSHELPSRKRGDKKNIFFIFMVVYRVCIFFPFFFSLIQQGFTTGAAISSTAANLASEWQALISETAVAVETRESEVLKKWGWDLLLRHT